MNVDIILIIGAKDIRFVRYSLFSLAKFWNPAQRSTINLVVEEKYHIYINNILNMVGRVKSQNVIFRLINREVFLKNINKKELLKLSSQVSQRYLKVYSYMITAGDFIWFVDADYLMISVMTEKNLISNGQMIWRFSEWEKKSVSEINWRAGSELVARHTISHNFMIIPPYLFKRTDLEKAANLIEGEEINKSAEGFSEFIFLGDYAYRNKLEWTNFVRVEKNSENFFTVLLHQNPITGAIDLSKTGVELEYENVPFLVYWSHHGEIENIMLLKLRAIGFGYQIPEVELALLDSLEGQRFIPYVRRRHIAKSIRDLYSYSDEWVYDNLILNIAPGFSRKLIFDVPENSQIVSNLNVEMSKGGLLHNIKVLKIGFSFHRKIINFNFHSNLREKDTHRILNGRIIRCESKIERIQRVLRSQIGWWYSK
jgi:hypothetical protein